MSTRGLRLLATLAISWLSASTAAGGQLSVGTGTSFSLGNGSLDLGCADYVTFTGPVPNAEIPAILNRARVAAVPSIVAADHDQEGLGLVAVEAMGCGCAVVASDLPALRDVVTDGESGLMVEPGGIEDLADALQRLNEDPDLAGRLAEAGHREAMKFNWPNTAADYGRRYRELIEAPGGSSID